MLRHRTEEILREIGVLLGVFVPIDFVVAGDTATRRIWLLIFLALGLFFLATALIAEYRRLHVD
jgi:hypothetical protein